MFTYNTGPKWHYGNQIIGKDSDKLVKWRCCFLLSRIFQHFGKEIFKKIHRYMLNVITKMFDEYFLLKIHAFDT